jgi:hypothetical protein
MGGVGWLGRLGSFLGGAAPTYSGDGQPSSNVGVLGRVTPAYQPAPTQENVSSDIASAEAQASCPIDPEALASGRIAILIPRQWDPCRDEETAATD